MLKINLEKLLITGLLCANYYCKKDPRYLVNILGNVWYIKVDTTIAIIELSGKYEFYCGGCIDEIYYMFKSKLDPKLRVFH